MSEKERSGICAATNKRVVESDLWELYVYAIKAPATKAKYCQRLRVFLEILGYNYGSLEDKARAFAAKARADSNYAFNGEKPVLHNAACFHEYILPNRNM
jgi:hypothetical protein